VADICVTLTFSAKVNDGSYRPPIGLAAAKILHRACKILENNIFSMLYTYKKMNRESSKEHFVGAGMAQW